MPFYPRVLKSFRLLRRSTLACPAWVLKYKIQNTCIEVVSITYEKYSEARLGRSNTKCKICVLKLFGLLTKQSTEYMYWYHSDYCEKYSKAIAWRSNTKYKIRVLESFWFFLRSTPKPSLALKLGRIYRHTLCLEPEGAVSRAEIDIN